MTGERIAAVAGSFHRSEAEAMVAEAARACAEEGAVLSAPVWTPGAMEAPLAVKRLLLRADVDAVVVLGIIEKGRTLHGAVMGQAVIDALLRLQLEYMKPVGVGIMGPGIDPDLIPPRLLPYAKGAALAAVHMLRQGYPYPNPRCEEK
jgi:6,7-dimethyl-8-ribityllumazine synthase